MKIQKAFKEFLSVLHSKFPEQFLDAPITENEYKLFDEVFMEDPAIILQRKDSLFDKERIIFGHDLSSVWPDIDDAFKKTVWKHLQLCTIHSFLHGDVSSKIDNIMQALTPLLKSTGNYSDEIDSILGKEETKSQASEIIEFLKNSKLLNVFLAVCEGVDLSSLNEDAVDVNNLDDFRNNETIKNLQADVLKVMQAQFRSGNISQADIAQDIQTLMVKVQSIFGDSMNDMLGTRKGPEAKVALSNSPEARKARMVARMQRKLNDKK